MGRDNVCRKDFAMGKGKSIYGGYVWGNRRGREWRGGERLEVRFHQRTRQTNKAKNTKWSEKWGFKAPRFDFQKGIALTYCRLKDISLNKTHGKAVGPLVKPITATVVIQLPYTVMIMIIKHKPESHIAISGNMLGLKKYG